MTHLLICVSLNGSSVDFDDLIVDRNLARPVSRASLSDRLDEDSGKFFPLAGVAGDGDAEALRVLDQLDVENDHLRHLVHGWCRHGNASESCAATGTKKIRLG